MIYFIKVFLIISSSKFIFIFLLSLSYKFKTKLNTFFAYKFDADVGSLFKNPVITHEKYKLLARYFPNIRANGDRHGVKLSAAWLIDSLGLKGEKIGGISVSRQHALVLINNSAGTFDDLKKISELIKTRVHSAYDVSLEIEPAVLPARPI